MFRDCSYQTVGSTSTHILSAKTLDKGFPCAHLQYQLQFDAHCRSVVENSKAWGTVKPLQSHASRNTGLNNHPRLHLTSNTLNFWECAKLFSLEAKRSRFVRVIYDEHISLQLMSEYFLLGLALLLFMHNVETQHLVIKSMYKMSGFPHIIHLAHQGSVAISMAVKPIGLHLQKLFTSSKVGTIICPVVILKLGIRDSN